MTATFPPRLWRITRSVVKWTAIAVGVLAILIILAYWEEDWRGAHDWAATKKELLGKGEVLDLRDVCPPGRPKDDLSKIPIFAEVYAQPPFHSTGSIPTWQPLTTRLDKLSVDLSPKGYGKIGPPSSASFLNREMTDLPGWQRFYRSIPEGQLPAGGESPASDVLRALSRYDSDLNEIKKAVENPEAFFPINYGRPSDTRFEQVIRALEIAKVLSLRGSAHLANNEPSLGKDDFIFALKLARPLEKNCFAINCLVDAGVRAISNSILWEGIHRHSWNSRDLQQIESALAETDMLAVCVRSLRVERAYSLAYRDFMENHGPDAAPAEAGNYRAVWYLLKLIPAGWWNQDRKVCCLNFQKLIDATNIEQGRFAKMGDVKSGAQHLTEKMVEAETDRRLARLACRLEGFYLVNKRYPDSLQELGGLPPHLNEEVLTGNPLHYRHEGESYLLYSTSWDGKDRGGVGRKRNQNDAAYDWIWPGP